jgi:hypothetical protein
MWKKPLIGLLFFAVVLLSMAGITVKRGPASPTLVHVATFSIDDAAVAGDGTECLDVGGGTAQACLTFRGETQVPVYETDKGYTKVTIHRFYCTYEDGANLNVGDSITLCVAYTVDGTVTSTTSCLQWVSVDQVAESTETLAYTTPVDIPLTDFTLSVRNTAMVDAAASGYFGTCNVEYSGAN